MKNKQKKYPLWVVIVLIILGLIGGILIGMFLQQKFFIVGLTQIAEGLEGATFNIEVDLNETLIIESMKPILMNEINKDHENNFTSKNCTWDTTGERC